MKSKIRIYGVICVLLLSAYSVYSSIQADKVLNDLTLDNIEVMATPESSMHGRPLLYNSDYGYKCGNCSGTDCGAVC